MVNQWIIYDTYGQHEIEKELQEERERKKARVSEQETCTNATSKPGIKHLPKSYEEVDVEISKKFMKAAKILERMVNQNIYDQVIKGNYS